MFEMAPTRPPGSVVLTDLRAKLRYTQEEMAQALGLKRGTYKNYEYIIDPPDDLLAQVRAMVSQMRPTAAAPTGRLRVIGSAGAGPIPASESDEDLMYVPVQFAREDYQGLVLGQDALSMWPYLHPGDTLIFKASATPRAGKIVAVRLAGESMPVVKKMTVEAGRLALVSLNPSYPHPDIEGATMLGVLAGIISADNRVQIGPEDAGLSETDIESYFRSRLPT